LLKNTTTTSKFKGRMDALKNYTYDLIVMRQSELYVCTTKKIAD